MVKVHLQQDNQAHYNCACPTINGDSWTWNSTSYTVIITNKGEMVAQFDKGSVIWVETVDGFAPPTLKSALSTSKG